MAGYSRIRARKEGRVMPPIEGQDPNIRAEFILDPLMKPEFLEGRTKKHYKIKLLVDNVPLETHQILYELHPTYQNPIREGSRDKDFEVDITSYGDYELKVQVPDARSVRMLRVRLSEALAKSYVSGATPAISAALDDIKRY